jgi:hypothetical protein
MHRRLDQAIAMVEDALKKTTIAELASSPEGPQPLCDLPIRRRSRVRE